MRSVWRRTGVTIVFVTHDMDEAVYLGQRVLVLSSSPTVVREDLAVDLPDERDQLTTRSDPRFTELRSRVYAQIHINHLFPKIGARDRAQAVAYAYRHDLASRPAR